jgi:hypothetical protein
MNFFEDSYMEYMDNDDICIFYVKAGTYITDDRLFKLFSSIYQIYEVDGDFSKIY